MTKNVGKNSRELSINHEPYLYEFSSEALSELAEIVSDLELAPKLKKRMSEKGIAVSVKIEDLITEDSP